MMVPLITVLPVAQRRDGEISGESFNSKKDAHSLCMCMVKSVSSRRVV